LITRLLEAGVAGANIEDVVHIEGNRVRDRREHADYIAAARQAADNAGVDFVINGRTDAVKLGTGVYQDPLGEAVERVKLMEQAGARAVYPVGLSSAKEVTAVVEATTVPVNATAHPVDGHGVGHIAELRELGVRRVTFGPLWQKWLGAVSADQLAKWTD
jgi:2-methylisocitrate lyase-like PEP mutase family enzyme